MKWLIDIHIFLEINYVEFVCNQLVFALKDDKIFLKELHFQN